MVKVSKLGLASGLLVFLTMLVGIGLAGARVVAGDDTRGGGEGEIACTLSYTAGDGLDVTLLNGVYQANIGNSTLGAVCNDASGFAVYTVGHSDNEYGNNKMLASINGALMPEYDIASDAAVSGDTSAWAMKASAVAGTYAPTIDNEFDEYREVPSNYTRLAYFESTTDDTVGSAIQLSYAIFVSSSQPSGNYTGVVKYTLVHPHTDEPCIDYKICYKKNGDDVVGKMEKQAVDTEATTTTLWASNYSRVGYGFAGWNTKADGTGTSYGPNETINVPDSIVDGLALYAMWVESTGDLQSWTGCYAMNIGQVTALTDTRDNDTYAVAKLADGNCWLIENLRLGNVDSSNNAVILSSSNTNNPSLPLVNSLDQSTGEVLTSSDSLSASQNPAVLSWCTDDSANCDNQSMIFRNSVDRVSNMTTPSTKVYSYGTNYNWYSATAGNGVYGFSGVASGDICPNGWFLPYGGDGTGNKGGNTSGGYYYLSSVMNAIENSATSSMIMRTYPANFIYSGQVNGASVSSRGVGGAYWTSAGGINGASSLTFGASSLNPGTGYNSKNFGRSVRCVTESIPSHNVTVNVDEGVSEVVLSSNKYGTKTVNTSGTTITLMEGIEYVISATYENEYEFDGWETTANGALGSSTSAETTFTVSDTATLSLNAKRICTEGYICYDKNTIDTATAGGRMANQQVSGTSAVLWASNYARSGYGFAGWNTEADGSGTTYGPNETITFDSTDEDGLMLYAVWVASAGNLQGWSCPNEANMPIGTVTALTDERDGDTYAVAKLADGNCWMIENLRLDNEDTVGEDNQRLAEAYMIGFTGLAEPETSTFTDTTTPNSLYTTDTTSTTLDIITGNNLGSRFPRYRNENTNGTVATMTGTNQRTYSYGNYYTYAAAIADTTGYTTSNKNAESSLCPAGWRLPTGGSQSYSDYWNLVVVGLNNGVGPTHSGNSIYDGNPEGTEMSKAVRKYPNNFVNSGFVEDGTAEHGKGTRGDYWSSTTYEGTQAYRFSFRGEGLNPGKAALEKYDGLTARCIADDAHLNGVASMQDFAELSYSEMEALKSSMVEDKQYKVIDERDNKTYYISKLADGNIWMTQNLDLDIDANTTYTPDDTDIPANWTPIRSTYEPTENGVHPWYDGAVRESWYWRNDTPESYDPGDLIWNKFESDWSDWKLYSGQCNSSIPSEPYCNDSLNPITTYVEQYGISQLHLGNYYNFAAAVATNDSSIFSSEGEVVDQSICPAGWTLPRAGSTENDFTNLWSNYGFVDYAADGDRRLWDKPIAYNLSGTYASAVMDIGDNGDYWSSVVYSTAEAQRVQVFGPAINYKITPNLSYENKSNGLSVRCIARTPKKSIEDLEYMQEFATLDDDEKAHVIDSMTVGAQYQLVDSRDDKVYYVSKLADGNVWMTQNLDHNIVTTPNFYTYDNTDIGHGAMPNPSETWTPSLATYTTGDHTWNNDNTVGVVIPESYDPGDLCWNGVMDTSDPYIGTVENMTTSCTERHYHLGNYYKWTAAVALSDGSGYSAYELDLDQSICPAGWRLPNDSDSYHGSGTFAYLINQANLTSGVSGNIQQSPNYLFYAGVWGGRGGNITTGDSYAVGGGGLYWSSVMASYDSGHALIFEATGNMLLDVADSWASGHSVRCLLRQ